MQRPSLNLQFVVVNGVILALIAVSFVLMRGVIHNLRSSERISDDEKQLILTGEIERRVIDVEAGQRGYVIAGKPEFLAPRSRALRALPRLERRLLKLEAESGTPSHVAELRTLFAGIRSYVRDYSARVIAVARRDPARARAIISRGEGRRQVADLRRRFSAYSTALAREADQARSDARDSANRTVLIGVICLAALALLTAAITALIAVGVVRPMRRFAKAAGELSAGDLTVRIEEEGAGEVRVLGQALNSMATSLESNREELRARQALLEQAIEELSAERDRARRFHEFVAHLAGSRQLAALGETMLEDLCGLAECDAAALFVIDVRGGTELFWLAASRGFAGGLPKLVEPGAAVRQRRAMQASHLPEEVSMAGEDGPVEVRHELHLPVLQGEETLGVVVLARAGEDPFEPATVEELEQVMHSAAAALATALALRTAENAAELNRAVLGSVRDAYIATDKQGLIEMWSPQATALYGFSEEEAAGKDMQELLLREAYRAEHLRRRTRVLDETKAGSHLERFEAWTSTKAGRQVLAEISIELVRRSPAPLVIYFFRDITERRRQEEVRRAEGAVSRALAEADAGEDVTEPILAAIGQSLGWTYGAFWIFEERTGRLRCTQSWSNGRDEHHDIERLCIDATADPNGSSPEFGLLREAWQSGKAKWDVLRPSPGASELRHAVISAGVRAELMLPVRSTDGTLGVIEFGARSAEPPSTATLKSLGSIADLIGQVVERRRALEEAERLKSEFFALVSHELRTPLTSVIGYLDVVCEEDAGSLDDEQQHYLNVIRRNTERLLRLVDDLLFVAQVEAGTLALEWGPVDLGFVVRNSVEAARPRADSQDISLNAEIEPVTMEDGDADRIGQLVDNLVSNALKFSKQGGTVTVRLRQSDENQVLIEVADAGIGISAEDQKHLFDRFYRAEQATQNAIQGIGLGLAICQAIAEGHGGSIEVESEEGEGTTFRVALPLGQSASVPLSAAKYH